MKQRRRREIHWLDEALLGGADGFLNAPEPLHCRNAVDEHYHPCTTQVSRASGEWHPPGGPPHFHVVHPCQAPAADASTGILSLLAANQAAKIGRASWRAGPWS